ncbi:hypothetical protein GCM10011506_46070 [Marivirga lumbricoides]|uniref:Transposase n=1 Tax=Marivirga lumbricoides TaxID=1046115 RepID=A0ABQ1N6H1_9BACT|nr:hypothetical protein GCM10011506_46070 [Marivirga lumbricoides]
MSTNHNAKAFTFQLGKDRETVIKEIIAEVEKGTGVTIAELKKHHSEDKVFFIALKHVSTTKKAITKALNIPVEGACRYKRHYEKLGLLIESFANIRCPYTSEEAKEICTNASDFERLRGFGNNQISLF